MGNVPHPEGPADPTRVAIEAKLRPPSTSPAQVIRRAIIDLVCSDKTARLVLIRAPAGFGKTTVMLQCRNQMQEAGLRTAWLTVDRSDNDVARFLICLTAALDGLGFRTTGESVQGSTLFDFITTKVQTPFALFIDELEVIREPAIIGLLRELVVRLPDACRLVVGTRSVPDLALGRMRARGHLLEIDAETLRFSPAESEEYLVERRGIKLDSHDRMLLHRKTEGWVAGLWLASAALSRHTSRGDFIARFSGSNVAVAEYLAEDVLDQQTRPVRGFLMRTSILRELNPSICAALVPGTDCEAVLHQLEAESILVTSLDGEVVGWRYHALFASFLKAKLSSEFPTEIAALHRSAAGWYEDNARPVRAIDHAIEGSDFPNALRLLDSHALSLFAAGRLKLLLRWLEAIPVDLLAKYSRLSVVRLWAMGLTRGPRDALAELERSKLDISVDPELQVHVMAMRPIMLAMSDDLEEAYRLGNDCLDKLPSGIDIIDSGLLSTLANLAFIRRCPVEALRLLDFRRRALGNRLGGMGDVHAESILGMMAIFEGRLAEATSYFRSATTNFAAQSPEFGKGSLWASILYAMAAYEAGALDEVRSLLQVYVPIARDAGIPDHVVLGYRMLCRLAFGRGDVDEAFQALAELESLGFQRQYPRLVASARLERSRLQLMQGHVAAARDELERGSDPAVWEPLENLNLIASELEYPQVCRLRWQICAGDAAAAIFDLDHEIAEATRLRRFYRVLKLRVLRVGALERSGERKRAHDEFFAIAQTCCKEGFVRIVADEAAAVGSLVRILLDDHAGDANVRPLANWLAQVRSAMREIERIEEPRSEGVATPFSSFAPRSEPDPAADKPIGMAPDIYRRDPLTTKEQRVLRLLAEGYSNAAMAEKLFVSDSTVRTHLRNINLKLAVRSRIQAVVAARRLGLLN